MPFTSGYTLSVSPRAATARRRTPRRRTAVVAALAVLVLPALEVLPAGAAAASAATSDSATSDSATSHSAAASDAEVQTAPTVADDFYTPPDPLPDGDDGEVIRWREEPEQLSARNYLVLYHSTNGGGQDIAVSGRVLVPNSPWTGEGPRPIVSDASGTRGLGDSCALSRSLDYRGPTISAMLGKGWAVALSDYEGLGTPGGHAYAVGQSEGRSVIDVVRAATNLPATGLAAGGKVAFSGYSQGGGAALWAGELQPTYAPELDLVGISAGGVPADLRAVARGLDGQLGFGLLLFITYGYNTAYPELDLQSYLNERGLATFEAEQGACVGVTYAHAFQNMRLFTTSDPLDSPAWQARLDENRLGANPPDVPIRLYHGLIDELVAPGQARTLRNEYCAAGADVQWEWHLGEHALAMVTGRPGVVTFLDKRFRDVPFTANC
ncbi:lipase family protein [Promicromonospora sp. Populi]|uniref:lipase family protein n=1 Tax=Promicromonospora sp. Populi TaxID=3239420 RepID=UPI0034E210A7